MAKEGRHAYVGLHPRTRSPASARLDIHPFPELRSPKDGPGQPNPEEARRGDLPCLVGRSLIVMHRTRCLGCAGCSQTQTRPKTHSSTRDQSPLSLDPTTMMPLRVPGTEDEGRTPTIVSTDEAASASKQGQAIWQTKTPAPTNSLQSDCPGLLFTPSPEGRSRLPWTRSRSLDGFGAQMRSSPP